MSHPIDIEPQIAVVLDARLLCRAAPAYALARPEMVAERLRAFLDPHVPGAAISGLRRLGGGASKEQFVFDLEAGRSSGRYVLRMDPQEGVVAGDRRREFEALAALQSAVPVPRPAWVDPDGAVFGQPALVVEFRHGVAKPPDMSARGNITGNGTVLGPYWRAILGDQFVANLAAIHDFDRASDLPSFSLPDADPFQAARWQVEWWSRIWREDKVASMPIMALARHWMLAHLPQCTRLAFVHGDYRTGNYLFDEASGRITTILDWEMCHFGDHHEDLAWAIQMTNGSVEDGRFYASGLMETDVLLEAYARRSGRAINPVTLHFYSVFAIYKSMCITLATAMRVAADRHSHQDVLMTWMAGCGHILHGRLCALLDGEPAS